VSREFKTNRVCVTLENPSGNVFTRNLHVRLPQGTTRLRHLETGCRIEAGWEVLPVVKLREKSKISFTFEPSSSTP